jgi:NAD(P)-dependent dehydrogenase (short-subunit alcohol dehydrogenase family)
MKTAIITGGNTGLGLATARAVLARPDWRVIIACRDPGRAGDAVATLRPQAPDRVAAIQLDLASLAQVRRVPDTLNAIGVEAVDSLVCNAGAQFMRPTRTADGHEATFGINHLGHFVLARDLAERMPAGGRIVFVASGTHDPAQPTGMPPPIWRGADAHAAGLDPDDADPGTAGRRAYSTSKLANVMCAYEMARRLQSRGIDVNAFDPGLMPGTGLARDYPPLARAAWRFVLPVLRLAVPNVNGTGTSGSNLAWLAASPDLDGVTGAYFVGRRPALSSRTSYDRTLAGALWDDSLRLTSTLRTTKKSDVRL